MWKKVAPLLIALSVALNLGVGGVWLAHAVNAYRTSRTIGEKTDGVWCPLHRSLGVTEEQWRRLEPDFLVFRQKSQALSRALNEKRGALIDLIASPQPDPEAIATKQDEILSYQGKMQELVIERLLHEKEVLTEDQQAALFRALRERADCVSGPMTGHGRGPGRDYTPLGTTNDRNEER